MDMMAIRRRVLMASGKKLPDTSPIVIAYDSYYGASGVIGVREGTCVTGIYSYQSSAEQRTIVYYVGNSIGKNMIVYEDNKKIDYLVLSSNVSERKIINAGSNGLAFTLDMDAIDLSHAYIKETGQIFFAGKNSPYYGYTNINDMPT